MIGMVITKVLLLMVVLGKVVARTRSFGAVAGAMMPGTAGQRFASTSTLANATATSFSAS